MKISAPAGSPLLSPEFVFGVATSAFQIEGAAELRLPCTWDTFCATPGKIRDGSNGKVACDHVHRWREDLDLVAALNVDAYRFSISWPRVLKIDGSVNEDGLGFYLRLLDALIDRGIKPFVTLYHWDLPQHLEDAGGWLNRDTAYRFRDYVDAVTRRLGARVFSYATLNEPWCNSYLGYELGVHAPGVTGRSNGKKTAHNLFLAHGLAMQVLDRNSPDSSNGIVLNFTPCYPASNDPRDLAATAAADVALNEWYVKPLVDGRYPDLLERLPAAERPDIRPGDLEIISHPLDFVGVNYYTRAIFRADDAEPYVQLPPTGPLTDMGWEVFPQGLTDVLTSLNSKFALPPIYVAENGAALADVLVDGAVHDHDRTAYIQAHLDAVTAAIDKGVTISGYFYWSLLDNFEWAEGYAKRFGIVHVDYGTQRRTLKESGRAYAEFLSQRGQRRQQKTSGDARSRAGQPRQAASMATNAGYTIKTALIVALGGFLMGFDASVISGVVGYIEPEFGLTKLELGWSVASLTLAATIAMSLAGPLSDRLGRKPALMGAALLYLVSAILSGIAPTFATLVAARLLAGLAVGAALLIAPMYIAEIAPPALRGRLVSINQLNIVVGISAAFFSNYLIVRLGHSDASWARSLMLGPWNWRWMLGIEAVPAAVYFLALFAVPESPRWLALRRQDARALEVLARFSGRDAAEAAFRAVVASLRREQHVERAPIRALWRPAMRLVIAIGVALAVLQQITGINAVFFYAPMIFAQSGSGADAAFVQAVWVGLVNLVCTLLAIGLIDRLGRRPLLGIGVTGIAVCMLLLSYGFGSASYSLTTESVQTLPQEINRGSLAPLVDQTFATEADYRTAVVAAIGPSTYQQQHAALVNAAIRVNPALILLGILGFVASFAVSLGPVMWVVFSELFPNRIRGIAISFVGLINSAVSFTVQLVFPWELERLGSAVTFLIYGLFAAVGVVVVLKILPETKGKSLEDLEASLVQD